MAAIVGVDAAVLIAPVSDLQFTTDATYHIPQADELPTWNPSTRVWSWNNPNTLTNPYDDNPWVPLPERNELSISISVDVAEHKPFVSSLAYAWVDKARTWMNWSGSFSGYYTDSDDSIFSTMKSGVSVWMVLFDSRYVAATGIPDKAWLGKVLLTSVDHTTGSEDFSTLDVDFEGLDPLYRIDQT